jgi:thymidylate kinase
MSSTGMLYVFEGPDGVGKSTLASAFAHHLGSRGVPCECLSFPGRVSGTLGELVYRLHHDPARLGVSSIHPLSLQVLHLAAHVDSIEHRILPALRDGKTVILDRFWWSTWVYGTAAGVSGRALKILMDVEAMIWGDVQPSAVFLIDRSKPFRYGQEQGGWLRLRKLYRDLGRRRKRRHPVHVIVNNDTQETALQTILELTGETPLPTAGNAPRETPGAASSEEPENGRLFGSSRERLIASSVPPAPVVFSRLAPAVPTIVYETYWRFAAERQAIFFRRVKGCPPPWTEDPILRQHKFTNAYRVSDRTSQFLIKRVIYAGDQSTQEVFFRTILFKLFNRMDTWERLESELGALSYAEYYFDRYDRVLTRLLQSGQRIYSAAYIMPSGRSRFGSPRKHQNHLRLLELMMAEDVPLRVTQTRSLRQLFELLKSYPMMGDFLAFQYAIDLNYSALTQFSEMECIVPGPGARDGIRKCFSSLGGLNEAEIIKLMAERQAEEFERMETGFQSLWGRPLQLIDIQNLLCEVDKYARLAHPEVQGLSQRMRIKQQFRANMTPIDYWFPPKWGLNERINTSSIGPDCERV